jgi:4-amino-4-deoxy-L-arabinose transferase-like glycosyltransferase
MVSGLCVVAAVLTKGPVGLFPLAAPLLFWRISGPRRASASLGGQWGAVVVCALAVLSFDTPRTSLALYFDEQVLASLGGRRELSAGSWTILFQLVGGVLAPMILAGGLIAAAARRYVRPPPTQVAHAAALFLLGLAGTLPIVASVKQAGHYLVPAVPLYALAAACLFAPTVASASERFAVRARDRVVIAASAVVLLVAIGVSYVPALERDRPRLADLDVVAASVPRGATIGICPDANGDWGLHAWFERRFDVSLDAAHGPRREWFLATAAPQAGCPPVDCAPATEPGRQLVLMRCSR